MTVVFYHSTLISKVASQEVSASSSASLTEAAAKTSSQIFLSRGVASADIESKASTPRSPSPTFVMSVFESDSRHVMTLGNAAAKTASSCAESPRSDSGIGEVNHRRVEVSTDVPTTAMKGLDSTVERIEDSPQPETNVVDKEKGKAPERGRTLERGPRFPNPLARAESRPRKDDAAIELDVQPIEKRQLSRSSTFFDDPNDPCAIFEDELLEPCPHLPICNSVSEVLSSSGNLPSPAGGINHGRTWGSFGSAGLDYPRPTRAFTTVFNECRPHFPEPTLPPQSRPKTHPNIDHLESVAVTSSTPMLVLPGTATHTAEPNMSTTSSSASRLPTEIVQQIYSNLAPADFNSARHTCRSWLISSLNRSLLETILKRAGFSNRIPPPATADSPAEGLEISPEWSMSKSISQECALGPDWTGNGLSKDPNVAVSNSAFVETSSIDFTEVGVHFPGPIPAGSIFTVSSCGRFLMVANGCLVYLYELNRSHKASVNDAAVSPGALRPVTGIICPRRVLACSMDTSSNRYAVAILLDGRMGLVCDIDPVLASPAAARARRTNPSSSRFKDGASSMTHGTTDVGGTSFLDRVSLRHSASNSTASRAAQEAPFVFPGIATTGASFPPVDRSGWQDEFQGDVHDHTRTAGPSSPQNYLSRACVAGTESQTCPVPEKNNKMSLNSMTIENGPRSLYRNLCSDDDPPRSVAICPQRRCVAFGCSSGIELHWVDALTGQDLNRWFPLTAPSDFLYFLPPRRSVDSAKKLRLISSAARPDERPAISERAFGGRARSSPFWESLPVGLGHFDNTSEAGLSQGFLTRLRNDSGRSSLTGRMDCSDHYRAIPLSDGYHILFTDPTTGLLCLGSDAPVGGPTKLLRKIWFQGPAGKGSPVAYAAGADLSYGIRVVAAFDVGEEQAVWLFTIPTDIFATNQGGQSPLSSSSYLRSKSGRETKNTEWIDWWPDDGLQEWLNHAQDPVPGILPRSVWPVKIRGQQIGTCSGLVDLAVDSGPEMIVWALNKYGMAKVWKVGAGEDESVKSRWIMRDGTVRESEGDGDIEMSDAPAEVLEHTISPATQESFDGTVSFSMHHNQVQYDPEGDVLMDELPDTPQQHIVDQEEEAARFWYREGWAKAFRSWHGPVADLVEEVTGATRIDVEIR